MGDSESPTKPPYTVPTMEEIALVRGTNGYRMVSTFSGCGGSCLGFEMAGFEILWASEFIPAAQEVYRANHPTVHLDTRDIRDVTPDEILAENGLTVGELDVLEGSPPCSAFSMSGKRERGWGKTKDYSDGARQVVDDLFFEYARLLDGIQPKVFVAENVSGLVRGTAKGYMHEIVDALEACGYTVKARLLDAQWLGVPQRRQRVIFVGTRKDLACEPAFPSPLPYRYSINEAFATPVASVRYDAKGGPTFGRHTFDPDTEPAWAITVSGGAPHLHWEVSDVPDDQPETIKGYAIESEWELLRPGDQSDKYLNLLRPHPDDPCPTVTAIGGHPGTASVTHPAEKRKFTIAELKRLCAFPDDFALTGSYPQQWERLGRAVPPLMMRRVAETVRDRILPFA